MSKFVGKIVHKAGCCVLYPVGTMYSQIVLHKNGSSAYVKRIERINEEHDEAEFKSIIKSAKEQIKSEKRLSRTEKILATVGFIYLISVACLVVYILI